MIDVDDFIDLPEDPEEGFAALQIRKFKELEEQWKSGSSHWNYERNYVNVLVAYDEVHDLKYLEDWRNVPISNEEFSEYFNGFMQRAEIIKQKIFAERARRLKSGASDIVMLDAAARIAIHKFIQAIRQKLDELTLPDNKREALFNKLNIFAAEVDRNRTRTEAFNAFAVEIARTARAVNDEVKPLQDTIDRIFDWLEKATKWKDTLIPWSKRQQIEGPKKQLPAAGGKPNYDLDDDIPF